MGFFSGEASRVRHKIVLTDPDVVIKE
jgi:hypothetical protein